MPECAVCGLEDFEERNGLFFCTTCQTQTQELILEEDDFEQNEDTGQVLVNQRLQIREKTGRKQQSTGYKGRPWTIYEAYQIVLKHQVAAFIRLGASPKLEEFVFRLWALYLSKLEVAFCKNEQLYPSALKTHLRHREKYSGNSENPITPAVRNIRVHRKRGINKVSDAVCPAIVQEEEFYEEDDPTQSTQASDQFMTSDSDEEDGSSEKSKVESTDARMRGKPAGNKQPLTKETVHRNLTKRVEWVNLSKLLSLCHLGLLYTNGLTTPADIIRWLEDGEVPFMEVSTLIPEEFQFGSYDPQLFTAQIPKPHALRQMTGNMAYFLGITKLPPVPVTQLISKYLLVLNLPADFHGLVIHVVSQHPPQCQFVIESPGAPATLPFFEALAMAYIIMTLKLWFGLDDYTEKKLSQYSRDMMELIEHKHQLFVFEDWRQEVTKKISANKSKPALFSKRDVTKVQDVDSLLEGYYRSGHDRRRAPRYYCRNSSKAGDYNRYNQSTKDDLASPFKLAADKIHREGASPSEMDEVEGQSEGHIEQNESAKGHNSRFSSMKHITRPETFLMDLERHGLSEETLNSSCRGTSTGAEDMAFTEMGSMSVDSDGDTSEQSSRGHESDATEAVRHVLSKIQEGKKVTLKEDMADKMADIKSNLVSAQKNYIMYKRILIRDKDTSLTRHRHQTYSWLVALCADIISCTSYELDVFVLHLSHIYFNRRPGFKQLPRLFRKFQDTYFGASTNHEDFELE